MLISGLQKLTLLDFPGRVACTVFTGGCNFRCPFCHNASLVLPERLEQQDEARFFDFLRKRRGMLEGVAVTGGEPLIHRDIKEFLYKIRELGYKIKLDTNGCFPEKLEEILSEGLVERVAMDVKNAPELYAATAGLESVDIKALEKSRDLLMQGEVEYEFRTTIVKGLHTAESVKAAAKWIEGAKEYYLQQYKDSGDILSASGLSAFDNEEMNALAQAAAQYVPAVKLRGV